MSETVKAADLKPGDSVAVWRTVSEVTLTADAVKVTWDTGLVETLAQDASVPDVERANTITVDVTPTPVTPLPVV